MAQNCDLNLRQDVEVDIEINKYRDNFQEILAEIYSGETFISNFDFSAYTGATLQIKVKQQDSYTVLQYNTDDGSIVLGINGLFSLIKTPDELKNIKAGSFYYDMYLRSAALPKRPFLYGKFNITQNVSI